MGTANLKSPPAAGPPIRPPDTVRVTRSETFLLGDDRIAPRLGTGLAVSLLVNALLWWTMSGFVKGHLIAPPAPIEVQRVILRKDKKIVPVKLKPKVLPRPKPKMLPPKPVVQRKVEHTPPPPPAPHVHVMAAKPTGRATPEEPPATPGGHLTPGTPVEHEGAGEQSAPPPPAPAPAPAPKPELVTPAPPPPTPKPAPEPAPAPPPGPTRDAQPGNQVKPEIPDDLKQQQYKSFVRVKVVVEPDGSFSPVLRTSSGNAEIDRRVLDALRKWTWKAALSEGKPVESTAYFRFEFEVN
ncbi:MAG: TonB family protein [Capsulimonadaceae bacterium]|nr:TonB family protein [Capsulimonadaceae bacterium]